MYSAEKVYQILVVQESARIDKKDSQEGRKGAGEGDT